MVLFTDQSLNPHLLVPVFRAITADWHQIGGHYITVPQARVRLFNVNYSDQNEITAAAAVYYSLYHYDPSWKELAVWLYRAGETEAVGMAKPHILTVIGMYIHLCAYHTLTLIKYYAVC